MTKQTMLEPDEAKLKKKVRGKLAATDNPEADAALRSLHKRLKRAQRKRRRLALRKRHAMGKQASASAKTEAAPTPKSADA
ncbi:MAG: hypothetical protein E6K69_03945 [Nitrospirae bacterium]|nr:MAG: hypothetical protein E6K69_03945 [Nitrospirota bacterium]